MFDHWKVPRLVGVFNLHVLAISTKIECASSFPFLTNCFFHY